MKRFATLLTVLSFGLPTPAQALPRWFAGNDHDKAGLEEDCPPDLFADMPEDEDTLGSELEIIMVTEVDAETGEVLGPVQIIMIPHSVRGLIIMQALEQEMSQDWLFEPCDDFSTDFDVPLFQLPSFGAQPENEPPHPDELLLWKPNLDTIPVPMVTTICENKNSTPPPRDDKKCEYYPQPAITNDEVLLLLASFQQTPENPHSPPPRTHYNKKIRPGLQDFGRRHAMTSRAG